LTTTLTATAEPSATPPRILLELEWTGGTDITVQRIDPDGRTRGVRLAEPATLDADLWSGYDYESWFGEATTYQATDGSTTIDATPVTLTVDAAWLRHPGVPSVSVQVNVEGDGEPTRAVNRAVLEPLGRRYPIVVTDGRRKTKTSIMTFRTYTLAEADALLSVLDDTAVVLLDVPPAWGWGITHQYMAVGDVTETRTAPEGRGAWVPCRNWSAPYEVVDRPADAIAGDRTWANVLVEAATWADLVDMYDTWSDVLTGNTSS
jgi:hypothetical protein